ncbi:hypothetical protein MNB_SV-13-93 [hydrothermal vent metagenome]|uniref:Uncharacterized protein n=1 Tax=hydrothermal vent metagenome TaxID=652676 RepID=A0A1W1CZY4_9ZZZZ
MREILLVGLSAVLGYIVFSAFSTTGSSQEAFRKILEQPHTDMQLQQELAFSKLANDKEARLIVLDNEHKKAQLKTYENIKINEKENNTKVELKNIDYKTKSTIVNMKLKAQTVETTQRNYIYIFIAILLFLLIFIYLRYQKYLSTMELEKETEYRDMIAKKEYAEKILNLLATGNLTFETERKLLKVLDEINGKKVEEKATVLYHPNPEIAQLNAKNEKKYLDI